MDKVIENIRKKSLPILKKNGVVKAGLFGSVARGEARKNSDIDMLIKFKGRKSLFDLVGLQLELEEKFKRKFDVLTYKSIYPPLKKTILGDEVRIL
ncbi:MAG: nucleotidyltransferase family protein [Nanoarchaeota archaeon]|nr:nucleotidyltransferase family protein [Nanoarchaeota archaeon]